MALSKAQPTLFGVDATYHKILRTDINWHARELRVQVMSWLDASARQTGRQPLDDRSYNFNGAQFPLMVDGDDPRPLANIVAAIYEMLKTLPEWAGATDA